LPVRTNVSARQARDIHQVEYGSGSGLVAQSVQGI
jgi:hypothetical protein